MEAERAVALLRQFAASVASWQRQASAGRGHGRAERDARRLAARLFAGLVGREATDDEAEAAFLDVGLV